MRSLTLIPKLMQQQEQNSPRLLRTACYKGMASLLWQQYSLEHNIARVPFEHAPKQVQQELLDLCESTANAALSADLKDTAILCMADAICRGNSGGTLTIAEVSKAAAQSYLATAEAALQALRLNLRTEAPDPYYRDAMCRLLDAVVPKQGVH